MVKDASGLRTDLFEDGTRMLLGGTGDHDVTTLHRRTEVHDTYGSRCAIMANDAHILLGTTHAMALTVFRIQFHD